MTQLSRDKSCNPVREVLLLKALLGFLCSFCFVVNCFAQQPFTALMETAYQKHKTDLYSEQFADGWFGPNKTDIDPGSQHLLVIKKGDWDKEKQEYLRLYADGIGDSAWRTGLATIAVVLEGDNEAALNFLTALSNECWDDGQPIRHPRWEREERDQLEGKVTAIELNRQLRAKWYSQDAYIHQMAACYLACKYSKDDRVKSAARALLTRFIATFQRNDWKFGPRIDATLTFPGQYVLWCAAKDLDLPHNWHPSVERWGVSFAEYLKRQLILMIVDEVTKNLNEQLGKASIAGQTLPAEVRNGFVRAVREFINAMLLRYDLEALLDKRQLDEVMNAKEIATGCWGTTCIAPYDIFELAVAEALKSISKEDDFYGTLYEWYVAEFVVGQFIRGGGRETNETIDGYYANHLTFWELVVLSECGKMGSGLRKVVKNYAGALEHHNNIPFEWLVGNHERAFGVLEAWPASWSNVEYMWKEDRFVQLREANNSEEAKLYPRLDYMVLFQLYRWKPDGLVH